MGFITLVFGIYGGGSGGDATVTLGPGLAYTRDSLVYTSTPSDTLVKESIATDE